MSKGRDGRFRSKDMIAPGRDPPPPRRATANIDTDDGAPEPRCAVDRQQRRAILMARYYVNKNSQTNGDHEVHTTGCSWLPDAANRIYLGDFASCGPAVREARKHYLQVNGCYYCSNACHTT